MVLKTGEEPAAGQSIEPRAGIPARDIDAFALPAILVPRYCDSVRGIFRIKSQKRWNEEGTLVFESDQTDSGD